MEIKQLGIENALKRAIALIESQLDGYKHALEAHAAEKLAELRDAAAFVGTIDAGLSSILDRAAAVCVREFRLPCYTQNETVPIRSLVLDVRSQGGGDISVVLEGGGNNANEAAMPRLTANRRYRAILLIVDVEHEQGAATGGGDGDGA